MTPVRVNASTFFQCRSLWIWHVWGLLVCLPPIILPLWKPDYRPGSLVGMIIVPLWSGIMATSLCRDLLSKPFSFGLPRHAVEWRRTLFTVGLVVSGACSLVFLLAHAGTPGVRIASAWQAFPIYLAIFLAGALFIAVTPNPTFLPGVLTLFLLIVFSDTYGSHLRVAGELALLANPAATSATAAFIVAGAWIWMGSRSFHRGLCGQPFLPLHGMWSSNRQITYLAERKLRQLRKSPGALMKSIEGFFLDRMRARSSRPAVRVLWGTLYIVVGRFAPARWSSVLVTIAALMVLTVILGFYHPRRFPDGVSGANLMMFLICVSNGTFRFNRQAALLLNLSRKNRLDSLVVAAFVQTAIVLVAAAVATFVSAAAGWFVRDVTVVGRTLTYDPIIWKAVFFFLPLLPIYFVSHLLFPNNTVIPSNVISIVAVVAVIASLEHLLGMPPLGILLLQVVSWLPFFALARKYCFFRDLEMDGR